MTEEQQKAVDTIHHCVNALNEAMHKAEIQEGITLDIRLVDQEKIWTTHVEVNCSLKLLPKKEETV